MKRAALLFLGAVVMILPSSAQASSPEPYRMRWYVYPNNYYDTYNVSFSGGCTPSRLNCLAYDVAICGTGDDFEAGRFWLYFESDYDPYGTQYMYTYWGGKINIYDDWSVIEDGFRTNSESAYVLWEEDDEIAYIRIRKQIGLFYVNYYTQVFWTGYVVCK